MAARKGPPWHAQDTPPPPIMPLLRRQGIGLRVFCATHACRPMTLVPLDALARAEWPDTFTILDARRRLRCKKCGTSNPAAQPDWPKRKMGLE